MGRRDFYEEEKLKRLVYIFSIVLVLSIVLFLTVFVMYNKRLKKESNDNLESLGMLEGVVPNEDSEQTSFTDDLSVLDATTNTTPENIISEEKETTNENKKENSIVQNTETTPVENVADDQEQNLENVEVKQELAFVAPVVGEISKDFAQDTLIYSNTLEEWTTHSGIDIQAKKTTIVTASEAGVVESIKNDPRYGLTVTISHNDGFKTVYSNLLTAEFVKENETVEKGQTIGTVGESSSFEIAEVGSTGNSTRATFAF